MGTLSWPGFRWCSGLSELAWILNRQVIQQTVPKMTALCRAWIIALIARASAQSGTTAAPPMADIVNLSGEKLAIYAIGTLVDGGKNEVPDFEVMTDLLGAGQSVKVKVMSVDAQRNRIGLALVS